jgi:hypothetical protein
MNNNIDFENIPSTPVIDEIIKTGVYKKSRKRKWWESILMYPTLFIAILGAIPQYSNWFAAWSHGIPANNWGAAKEQVKLWDRNFECSKENNLESIETHTNFQVGALVCPSGDVLVKVHSPLEKEPFYRWIGIDSFIQAKSFFSPKEAIGKTFSFDETLYLAQSESVLCQNRVSGDKIIRIVRDSNGNCWKEEINIRTGKVMERKSVSCNSSCE